MTNKDAIKAGLYTALWTFIALFGLSLVGWLGDVTEWATGDGATVVFPDPAVLVKAAAAAVAAAASGFVGAIIRLGQVATGRGEGVHYDK